MIANKLGSSFNEVKNQIKLRTINIDLGEVKFDLKVRILLKREMEDLVSAIASPPKEKVEEIYKNFTAPILKSIEEGGEGFLDAINSEKQMLIVKDDDIIVDGSSVKQVASLSASWQIKVEKYFSLLQSDSGEPINENFEQISEEFPESVIKKIVEEIENVLKPNYGEVKKN
jgi:hypothetical protein